MRTDPPLWDQEKERIGRETWPRILVKAFAVALWLITGVPAATGPIGSVVSQAPGHPQWQAASVAGLQFWIVGNEEFLEMDGHFRHISIFVEPEALTADSARAIFRHLSEQYPADDRLEVEVVTNDRQVREAENWFGGALRFSFGNVLPVRCGTLPQDRVSADFHRSDLSEFFELRRVGSDGEPISEVLRTVAPDCQAQGEGPVDLLEAAQRGCRDAAEWLLDRGLDPNVKAPHGGVPLVWAAFWGRAEIVKLLLERGAGVNLASSAGWTPLIAAAFRRGSGTTIDLLLRHGAAVNVHSQDGTTALMFAVRHQDFEAVKELITWGADVSAVDSYGRTALSYAQEEPRPEMVKLLKGAGAIQ
jgi:hypothetical protein